MDKRACWAADVEETVRWALQHEVADGEPSPAVWQAIRERVTATKQAAGATPLPDRKWMRVALNAAVACVVLLGLGVSMSLGSLALRRARGVPVGATYQMPRPSRGGTADGTLTSRLVWLASREPVQSANGRPRGIHE